MPEPAKTSARFQRAAAGERQRLGRQLEKLTRDAEELGDRLARIDAQRHALQSRIASIDELIGAVPESQEPRRVSENGSLVALRGGVIRIQAIRTLIESGKASDPIHYRDWFELLNSAGYTVGGKRPDAVFLNQISRSPLVAATTRAGVYRLNPEAVGELRRDLGRLQRELADSAITSPRGTSALSEQTARQHELTLQIGRLQRALDEAERSLQPERSHESKLAA